MSVEIQITPYKFNYTECNFLPHLLENDVHVYEILLSDNKILLESTAMLSDDEMTRVYKYFKQLDKERFIISRVALRNILSNYLHIANHELHFVKDKYGKYHLQNCLHNHIKFSISHAGNVVLLAFSKSSIGVDVELANSIINYEAIMQETFSETEKEFVKKNNDLASAFLNIWTKKEALLKAVGIGMVNNLHQLCTIQSSSTYLLTDKSVENNRFLVSQMPTISGYHAALATSSYNANNIYRYNYSLLFC